MRHDATPIDHLVSLLAKLPGLGPRSAKRSVLHLMKHRHSLIPQLQQALDQVAKRMQECTTCGHIDMVSPCHICVDPKRDQGVICVVEDIADLWAMERGMVFRGVYHVIGGALSALEGIQPEDLHIEALLSRVKQGSVQEVILALNATVEGQMTSHYISEHLRPFAIKITRLAHGIPMGGELDYLDEGTLSAAMAARQSC